jgi:hypothetical protein
MTIDPIMQNSIKSCNRAENITKAISVYQKKSCFHLELDPALQAEEDIANKRDANYLNLS